MPFCRTAAKALGEPIEELHRERNLRQQDQRLLAARQRFRHRFVIGLRFAGTRHAIKQRGGKAFACHGAV